MQKQYTKNCPYCGSDHVLVDAYAKWHVETQQWIIHSMYDDASCNDCGKTFDYSEIETNEVESENV